MSRRGARRTVYVGLALLFALHNDLWLWNDPGRILGLPVGLGYHVALCVAASALMALLVRFAWPDTTGPGDPSSSGS